MVNTRGRCSGICLSDNGKFFYTVMQKRKMLAKFKVVQKETNSKLAPLAKMETGQLLDCSTIFKAKIKSGLLAVSSKDGHISFHSTSLDEKNKNVNKLHFFHHDSGGIFHSDVSSEGCILAVNERGCLQLFQVKSFFSFLCNVMFYNRKFAVSSIRKLFLVSKITHLIMKRNRIHTSNQIKICSTFAT